MIAGRYCLVDRDAAALLDLCGDRGVSVWAAGVFKGGLLADPYRQTTFDYLPVADDVVRLARHLDAICRSRGVPLRATALQFSTRLFAVDAVVFGSGTVASVTDAILQWRASVPDELWSDVDSAVLARSDSTPTSIRSSR